MKKININCILDMSGSMNSIIEDARKGFNEFLKEQKQSKHKIKFTLMFFDTSFYIPYKNKNIKKVKKVNKDTYYANGGTALYDAIGISIDDYIDKLGKTPKERRADKTLFVILTDGEENSSKKYHKDLIKSMVTEMREEFKAEFIYLGANQDSCFQAESMGMNGNNSFDYDATSDGISIAYANMSKAASYYSDNDVTDNLFKM